MLIRFSVPIKSFIITVLFIFLLTQLFADSSHFFITKAETNRDITVSVMEDFRITLEGKGWYLNRYQRDNLAFRLRTIKTDRTIFLITPLREGASYLLFSHLNADVYVTVHIAAEDKTVPAPEKSAVTATPDTGGEVASEDRALLSSAETGTVVETTGKEEAVIGPEKSVMGGGQEDKQPVTKNEAVDSKPREKPAASNAREMPTGEKPLLKSKVYYIDKNRQKVEVPTRDENDMYEEAVKAMNSGEYSTAAEKLTEYLSSCSACRHRYEARLALAEIYSGQKEYDKALQNLDAPAGAPKALQKDMYIKKAEIYSITGDLRNAAFSYEKAYETDKTDIEILDKLGNVYYQNGEYEDALDTYEKGIMRGLVNDEILFRMASIYDRPGPLRNIEKAYRYYRELVDTFESSQYRAHSLERVRFFEKNFYNYR